MPFGLNNAELSQKVTPKIADTPLGVVEYADWGNGPPVVALHGAMGGYDQSLLLAQAIGDANYRFLALSRPGYLGTPIRSGKSAEAQGDLIAALLDTLRIPAAGVMTVSGGGPAAIHFGLRHPARCSGLILVSTCAGPVASAASIPLSFKLTLALSRFSWFGRMLYRKAEKNVGTMAAKSVRDPKILSRTMDDPDAGHLFRAMMLGTFYRMGERIDGTRNDIDVTSGISYPLEELNVPTLVVHGTEDSMLPFEHHGKVFQNCIPKSELLAVEGGEHVTIFTHRKLVRPKTTAFMDRYFNMT